MPLTFAFRATVWLYEGPGGWHFVTLPKVAARKIRGRVLPIGFGSVPVVARIGGCLWQTSVFPDAKSGSYLLPVKAGVRKKEKIESGGRVSVVIEVLVEGAGD